MYPVKALFYLSRREPVTVVEEHRFGLLAVSISL